LVLGVKGGGLVLADTAEKYKPYPLAGVEWLITRSHAGLYMSGSQAFFTQQAFTFRDPNSPADSGVRVIDLKNMRKLDIALMAFPGRHGPFSTHMSAPASRSRRSRAQRRRDRSVTWIRSRSPRRPFRTAK
jgi:hypothetical protein